MDSRLIISTFIVNDIRNIEKQLIAKHKLSFL